MQTTQEYTSVHEFMYGQIYSVLNYIYAKKYKYIQNYDKCVNNYNIYKNIDEHIYEYNINIY